MADNAITTVSSAVKDKSQSGEVAPILETIGTAIATGNVNSADMEAVLRMQYQVEDREAKRQWIAAYHAMQNELPAINKNGRIVIPGKNGGASRLQSKFATWDHIHEIITPILRRHGFALRFENGNDGGASTVTAVLSHVGGHVEKSGVMRLPIDSSGSKNPTQGVGSATSYGHRYTTISLLNIVTYDDDDGNKTAPAPSETAGDRDELFEVAEKAASCGLRAYERWFTKDISNAERAALVTAGRHAELKDEAQRVDAEGTDD